MNRKIKTRSKKLGAAGAVNGRLQRSDTLERLKGRVALLRYREGDIDDAKKVALELMHDCDDPRVRANMTKLIHDISLDSTKMELEIEKYESPPTQKVEHSGEMLVNIKLDNVDV
jgi:hypothetical protein